MNLNSDFLHLAGERRVVTVLFADIAGFTTLAENLDPEEVLLLINRCFDELSPIIERYGGKIDKFIGDEVMALFGAPIAHEDDPERALRAALDMLKNLQDFNVRWNTSLNLHIGINTGLVVAGWIGSHHEQSYSVIGDAANVSHRLVSASQPGEILVGADTYHLTESICNFEALPAVYVKGRVEAVQAYRLLSLRTRPVSSREISGLYSPMIGRDAELIAMQERSSALYTGQGSIVFVFGDAGLGKSRLVNEWRNRVQISGEPINWAHGHCLSYGKDSAYHLFNSLISSLLDLADHSPISPYLSHLLAIPVEERLVQEIRTLDRQTLQGRYAEAIRTLLAAICARAPLILILEDFHWADASSVELLLKLLPSAAELPILFCFISRSEHEAPAWKLMRVCQQGKARLLQLKLSSLSETDSRILISNLLHIEALPEKTRSLILQHAEGNPFFIHEVIRMLIEAGMVTRDSDYWIQNQEISDLEIPGNLQALLMARVDRLPEQLRKTIRVAAVIGRHFNLRLISTVLCQAGLDIVNASSVIPELIAADIIHAVPSTPETDPLEQEFIFQHTLVQEAIYHSLLHQDRRQLHQSIGETLESLYPNEKEKMAPVLAYHFGQSSDEQRALNYFILAGDVSYRQYALPEAIAHFGYALRLAIQINASPDILETLCIRLGRSLELESRYAEALEHYQTIETLAQSRGETTIELIALTEQAKLYVLPSPVNDFERAKQYVERALTIAQQVNNKAVESRLYWIISYLSWRTNQADKAIEYGERSLGLARAYNLQEQLAYTLQDIHRPYLIVNKVAEAQAALDEARELWKKMNNLPLLTDNLASTADLLAGTPDREQALEFALEALRLSQSIGNSWNQAYGSAIAGEVLVSWGQIDLGLQRLHEAERLAARAAVTILHWRLCDSLVWIYLQLGAFQRARHAVELFRVLQTNAQEKDRSSFNYKAHLAQIALYEGHTQQAHTMFTEAFSSFIPAENRINHLITWIYRIQVALAFAEQNYDDAIFLANTAIDANTQVSVHRPPMYFLGIKGQALIAKGDLANGRQVIEKALQQARTYQARLWLARFLLDLARIEEQCNQSQTASNLRQEAQNVIGYITSHIQDKELQQGFLHTLLGLKPLAKIAKLPEGG